MIAPRPVGVLVAIIAIVSLALWAAIIWALVAL